MVSYRWVCVFIFSVYVEALFFQFVEKPTQVKKNTWVQKNKCYLKYLGNRKKLLFIIQIDVSLKNDILTYLIRSLIILLKKFYISSFSISPLCIFCLSPIWTVMRNWKQNTSGNNLSITDLPNPKIQKIPYFITFFYCYLLLLAD